MSTEQGSCHSMRVRPVRFFLPESEATLFISDPSSGVCLCGAEGKTCVPDGCFLALLGATCGACRPEGSPWRSMLRGSVHHNPSEICGEALPRALLQEIGGAMCASLDYSFPRTARHLAPGSRCTSSLPAGWKMHRIPPERSCKRSPQLVKMRKAPEHARQSPSPAQTSLARPD